ncbi:AAA family ATPase [Desulfitobacterium metallireducens]|uniref:ATPase AAA-type core domain-containing protein n=1 Tax=Desulfitobacterium metallireducens DSM 15288 TaxID=871968 RepID=W0EGP5_9FIRM|nr:AAA family ATPase [Desulfitobacterium metallireducens]AHF08374.1 hypothetical protein DESME_01065 [Desulfitobacterium metallireducens DSM 15288]
MELIYIWINEYRTFKDNEINLSNKFIVKYIQESNSILIRENTDYFKLYPKHILNISALLGKNSTGKSNLIDLMGMRINDRNNLNEEFEIVYKAKMPGQLGYLMPDDIVEEKKKARYFFLYYLGKDEDGLDKFCIEGNDIDSYLDLFSNKERINTQKEHNPINYWREKYWFAFVCTYYDEKLIYKYNVQEDGGFDSEQKKYNLTTKDKVVIISFREKYKQKNYYNHSSFKSEDDYRISIPRRIAHFDTKYLYKKIEFLIDQMKKKNKELYTNSSYNLSIKFAESPKRKDIGIYDLDDINKGLSDNEKAVCKILSSFCFFFTSSVFPNEEKGTEKKRVYFANINKVVTNIKPKGKTYKNIKTYYWDVLKYIVNAFFKEDQEDNKEQDINHFFNTYKNLEKVLEKFFINLKNRPKIKMVEDNIYLTIDKYSNKKLISELIRATIDEKIDSDLVGTYSVFLNFFDYSIEFLSDGELAFLGMMASIDEQISLLTQLENSVQKKEKYILLFDEPESRMHPELARIFMKTMIDFLSQYKDKTFQIILASHSPFLVSDIPKTNIITLTKEEGTLSILRPCELDTFGQNIHSLLKDAFFMNFTMGEYARDKVEKVKKFLDGKLENADYDGEMTIQEAEKTIDLIGERVLKTALQGKLKKIKNHYCTQELKETINKYDNLSPDEKKGLIEYIIISQKGGDQR